MTLTDMANHICTQVGMTDTDDVSAAQMFLQRRLEMIWNSQLWRDSLLEATLAVNPDGSTTLEDTVWLPATGILLLPSAIEKVIAARTDITKLEAASLESYYRTDYDWLNYQGTPTDFQVLSPCVWQFSALATLALGISNSIDSNVVATVRTVDASGVSCMQCSITLASPQSNTFQALRVDTIAKPATKGNVTLLEFSGGTDLIPGGATYPNISNEYDVSGLLATDTAYLITWGENDTYFHYGASADSYTVINNPGAGQTSVFVYPSGSAFAVFGIGISSNTPVTAMLSLPQTIVTILAASNTAPLHQRIRLTQIPNVSTNLRVLGKKKCPIMGAYDAAPITNVEPSLMAFARGDLLLRQRQFGKAALAQQEGATLLKELANDEAIQQAGNFRIDPDNGFGNDSLCWTQPNSYNPLG